MHLPILRALLAACCFSTALAGAEPNATLSNRTVFVVPNFHPASCGWLTNWSTERNYCANSYLSHLDRVRDDANYKFVLSECNNLIAIANFRPDRLEEIKQRIKEGRVELPNAFFLEPTVSLSGGEALAKMGIEGLRWQQQVLGVKPRYCWAIDICGTHDQMPQICSLLGLEGFVYNRCSRGGKSIFWSTSPDGSRILTFAHGGYASLNPLFKANATLTEKDLDAIKKQMDQRAKNVPTGAPVLILGGSGDYSLPPNNPNNPSEFLKQWQTLHPETTVRFATFSDYVDSVLPGIRSGAIQIPTVPGGTGYTFDSFWIENPRIKAGYRRNEHALQTAETLSTIASLKAGFEYPVQPLYHAWLLMLLNMDRNTLWGSAGGMVFEHETSWDASDRLAWVADQAAQTSTDALRKLAGSGDTTLLFNPLNWDRSDIKLPSCGFGPAPAAESPKPIALPDTIETPFYSAKIDPATGALTSLKTKPSGREMLGGPANVLVTEKWSGHGDPGDFIDPRPKRQRIGSSSEQKTTITATESADAITVETRTDFHAARRVIRFNKSHPRIEFTTEVDDLPNLSVLVAEFPFAETPKEIRRGIPFGFSRDEDRINGIVPAVRWSDYSTPGLGGVALLDRGLSGREINDKTAVIYLYNSTEKYYGYVNAWLSGKGHHKFEYALVAHEADWTAARVPNIAWEYNCPPVAVKGCAQADPKSFLSTSDNVIVEAMRRDGPDIELRLVECLGQAGNATVKLAGIPFESVAQTDLVGGHAQKLETNPDCTFPVRPQQIVTLRFKTVQPVPEIAPLTKWDEMVPQAKREALNKYLPDVKGHPPKGH